MLSGHAMLSMAAAHGIPADKPCGPHSHACQKQTKDGGRMMIKALLERARAAPAGSRVVVLDVGANNGDWSGIELSLIHISEPTRPY